MTVVRRVLARWRRPAMLAGVLWCSACAPPRMRLPEGAGVPAADGAAVLRDATQACRAVSSMTAEIAVSGSVGGQRLRGRLLAGVAAPASARLEALAPFGQPLFIFVARGDRATLLLPRDRRVVERERPAAVLAAVAGVPLDAADLRIALTGCVVAARAEDATQLGGDWRVIPDGSGTLYLHRERPAAPWHVVAAVHQGAGVTAWRSEYRDFQRGGATAGLPAVVRLMSIDGQQFDLQLTLSQVELNGPLGAEVFTVDTAPGTETITLDELQRSGPLSRSSGGK